MRGGENLYCFYLVFLGLSNFLSNGYRGKITQVAKITVMWDVMQCSLVQMTHDGSKIKKGYILHGV